MSSYLLKSLEIVGVLCAVLSLQPALVAEEPASIATPAPLQSTGPSATPATIPTNATVPAPVVITESSADIRPLSRKESLGDYTLTWSEDFNAAKLDTTVWDTRTDTKFWSIQKADNVSVSGGYLHLALKKEKVGKFEYTGSGVVTKRSFRYGYFEASIKLPAGKGWHTTFFLTGHRAEITGSRQEIDILENDSIDPKLQMVNLHAWKPVHRAFGPRRNKTPDMSQDFHVYGCEFTPKKVRYFFDGELIGSLDADEIVHDDQSIWITCFGAPFSKTDHIDDTKLPGEVTVDWVRFYEKKK